MEKTGLQVPPSLQESFDGMRELVGLWQNGDESVIVPALHGSFETALCIRAIAEHAIALTESVLLLAQNGMLLQSVPLIRLTLECGITAAWVSVTPDAVRILSYGYAVEERRMMNHMMRLNIPVPEESFLRISAKIKELAEYDFPASNSHLERSKSFAGGELLYLPYRKLSHVSHAGESIMYQYLEVDRDRTEPEERFALVSPKYKWAEQALGGQVVSLILILTVWDELSSDKPWSERIQDIAERFRVDRTIRRP